AFIARSSGMERRGGCPDVSSASRPGAMLRSIRPKALRRKWRAAGANAPECLAPRPGGRPEKRRPLARRRRRVVLLTGGAFRRICNLRRSHPSPCPADQDVPELLLKA